MGLRTVNVRLRLVYWLWLFAWLGLAGCVRPTPNAEPPSGSTTEPITAAHSTPRPNETPAPIIAQLGTPPPPYVGTPTPDAPHYDAVESSSANSHVVGAGETLGLIAQRYNVTLEQILALNDLPNPDLIAVGQVLQLPGEARPIQAGPSFKIIPDSELVYGPAARDFDLAAFAGSLNGYLLRYEEEVEGQRLSGPEIVQLLADRYSINPRLLLAALEHRSRWLTQATGVETEYPLGYPNPEAKGLYRQLSWAANQLNWGYYGRAEGGLRAFSLGNDAQVAFASDINDGTAGVQYWLAAAENAAPDSWSAEAGPDGFYATYYALFGNPFGYAVEPLWPDDLAQPALALPWSPGETWYFTGGPHSAWNSGSAWGALDFAPPADLPGCVQSDSWVTAAAGGVVSRSGFGQVVVDLDGDGFAGTGWAITYLHLETRDRIEAGTRVETGDRLGHPSCEGGFSNGTHLHIVRSYNGRWVSADGDLPFVLDGWRSQGLGNEYDGLLVKGSETREACVCREDVNAVSREE